LGFCLRVKKRETRVFGDEKGPESKMVFIESIRFISMKVLFLRLEFDEF